MKKKSSVSAYLFMLPALIIYLSVIVFPIGYSFYISAYSGNGIAKMKYVGFDNYIKMFKDPVMWISFKNTIIWILLTVFVTMTVALVLALLLSRAFKGRTFFRAFFYFPCVISGISVAIIWRWIYNPQIGFINQFTKALGIDFSQTWLSNEKVALYGLFAASLWQAVGQPMIMFIAGIQAVPEDVLEAADIDGAGKVRKFFNITAPMIKETFIMVISTLVIAAMKVYDIVKGLTDGGPNNSTQVLASYMYNQVYQYNNIGYGTAIAIFMVVIMLIIIVPYLVFTARRS
jgi:hypothetical protein